MKKTVSIILIAGLCVSLLVGCKNENQATSEKNAEATTKEIAKEKKTTEQGASEKEATVQETTEKESFTQEPSVQETTKKETSTQKTSVQKTTEKGTSTQETTVQRTTEKEATMQGTTVQKTTEKGASTQETSVQKTTEKETTVQETTKKESTVQESSENPVVNPKTHLRVNPGEFLDAHDDEYIFERIEDDGCVYLYHLYFWEDGSCYSFEQLYVSCEAAGKEGYDTSLAEFEYKGVKYWDNAGGMFFMGTYNLTDEKIYISVGDEENIVLTMTTDGNMVVESVAGENNYLTQNIAVGNTYVYEK